MSNIIVLDDSIPEFIQQSVEDIFKNNFPWHYTPGISTGGGLGDANSGFANLLYSDSQKTSKIEKGYKEKEALAALVPLLYKAVKDAYDKKVSVLKRVRLGMFIKDQNKGRAHTPHIDQHYSHYTMLYYVNDSDGPTTFFENLDIIDSISPKRGRCVLFPGDTYHASSCPQKSDIRIVCNYNFLL
jgi:hypothetical protein